MWRLFNAILVLMVYAETPEDYYPSFYDAIFKLVNENEASLASNVGATQEHSTTSAEPSKLLTLPDTFLLEKRSDLAQNIWSFIQNQTNERKRLKLKHI